MDNPPTKITIAVLTDYLESRSKPDQGEYAFSYHITVQNDGEYPARLLRRRWVIASDTGRVQEVEGEGVVGMTPRLTPGQSFSYDSWAMIESPTGQMRGEYLFTTDEGEEFWVAVPPFLFIQPGGRVLH